MPSDTFTLGDITAVIGDNDSKGEHRAGYNGIWSLTHKTEPTNIFVPIVAGMNSVLCTTEYHVATLDFCAWRRRSTEVCAPFCFAAWRLARGDLLRVLSQPGFHTWPNN